MATRGVGVVWLATHGITTIRLVFRLLTDARVGAGLKVLFLSVLVAVGVAELVPDAGIEVGSWLLPGVGPILGLGTDAVLDWTLLIPVILAFVRLAPQHVVAEHLRDIRGDKAPAGERVVDGEFRRL
jgi:hypothetical protein